MWPFIHWGEFATPIWPHDVNDWILDREIDDSLASFAEDNSGEIAACNQGERTRRETRECYLNLSKRVIILSMMSCGILFCYTVCTLLQVTALMKGNNKVYGL